MEVFIRNVVIFVKIGLCCFLFTAVITKTCQLQRAPNEHLCTSSSKKLKNDLVKNLSIRNAQFHSDDAVSIGYLGLEKKSFNGFSLGFMNQLIGSNIYINISSLPTNEVQQGENEYKKKTSKVEKSRLRVSFARLYDVKFFTTEDQITFPILTAQHVRAGTDKNIMFFNCWFIDQNRVPHQKEKLVYSLKTHTLSDVHGNIIRLYMNLSSSTLSHHIRNLSEQL